MIVTTSLLFFIMQNRKFDGLEKIIKEFLNFILPKGSVGLGLQTGEGICATL